MANNYSQFSEIIPNITKREQAWIEKFLKADCPSQPPPLLALRGKFEEWCDERGVDPEDEDSINSWPDFDWNIVEDNFPAKCKNLWLFSEEGPNTNHLVAFVQAFLKKFRPEMVVTMTGAETCSKLRLGEFGGWWLAISAEQHLGGNTWDEAADAAKLLRSSHVKQKKTSRKRGTSGK